MVIPGDVQKPTISHSFLHHRAIYSITFIHNRAFNNLAQGFSCLQVLKSSELRLLITTINLDKSQVRTAYFATFMQKSAKSWFIERSQEQRRLFVDGVQTNDVNWIKLFHKTATYLQRCYFEFLNWGKPVVYLCAQKQIKLCHKLAVYLWDRIIQLLETSEKVIRFTMP